MNSFFSFFLPIILPGLLLAFSNSVIAQEKTGELSYTVKPGDNLSEIALKYDHPWKILFDTNKNILTHPDSIKPGQTLMIPSFKKFQQKINQENKKTKARQSASEADQDSLKLKKLRKAFNQLTNKQEAKKNKENKIDKKVAKEEKIRNGLDIGGLVINKTRSKMGRDFFNAFYEKWDSPEDTGNFMLEISEQPTPSMGAMVSIKIDNNIIYKTRLQPRGSVIQKKATKSITICYRYIQQQTSSSKTLTY